VKEFIMAEAPQFTAEDQTVYRAVSGIVAAYANVRAEYSDSKGSRPFQPPTVHEAYAGVEAPQGHHLFVRPIVRKGQVNVVFEFPGYINGAISRFAVELGVAAKLIGAEAPWSDLLSPWNDPKYHYGTLPKEWLLKAVHDAGGVEKLVGRYQDAFANRLSQQQDLVRDLSFALDRFAAKHNITTELAGIERSLDAKGGPITSIRIHATEKASTNRLKEALASKQLPDGMSITTDNKTGDLVITFPQSNSDTHSLNGPTLSDFVKALAPLRFNELAPRHGDRGRNRLAMGDGAALVEPADGGHSAKTTTQIPLKPSAVMAAIVQF
jgi:hypothetical protein